MYRHAVKSKMEWFPPYALPRCMCAVGDDVPVSSLAAGQPTHRTG